MFQNSLILSLISAFGIALLSIIGIIALSIKDKILHKILVLFVSFSAGTLLGGAFFHLLPEAIEGLNQPITVFQYTIIGIGVFFILERILRWHHCHEVDCEVHGHIGHLNLIGDAMHNLIDGIILISAFSVSNSLGFAVVLSIALHEVPQEISDYGVLLYSGFKKTKALIYNFISALTVVMGVGIGYLLINEIRVLNSVLLSLAAGGFIYIAMSDLIPELHKEKNINKSVIAFIVFTIAVICMLLLAYD